MSSIYNLEPQPTGSVVFHTTQGELAVELFAKQTPLTCRNFLQLCMDGYYDDTIFHRLIPGFILQGGDPTGTGRGGECIYDGGALSGDLDPWPMDQRRGKNAGPMGVCFKDEFHSRLKFNRRGLLGMANEGSPDTNGSQFFFTLGKTEELNGKNTMFGRVAGDTIYNLAKMGEAEVEEGGERPLYPMKITRVEILINPFEGMEKREKKTRAQAQAHGASKVDKKQKKRKGGKQLLSFGDEEGDEDLPVIKKPKFDTRIVMDVEEEAPQLKTQPKASKKKPNKTTDKEPEKEQIASKPAPRNPSRSPPAPVKPPKESQPEHHYVESSPEPESATKQSLLERTNAEIAAVKASMRRTIHTEPVKEKKKSALEALIPENSIRARKRRPGGANTNSREEQAALNFLNSFKNKLEQTAAQKKADAHPIPKGAEKDGDKAEEDGDEEVCDLHFIANCQSCKAWDKDDKDDSDDEGWMAHTLSFAADKLGKDLSYRKKAEEELVVIDPLAKARTLQEERKAGRDARNGASSRAWDRGRK